MLPSLHNGLRARLVISSDITDEDIKEIGVESLTAQALSYFEGSDRIQRTGQGNPGEDNSQAKGGARRRSR